MQFEIKTIILLTLATHKSKIDIILKKYVPALQKENYKTLIIKKQQQSTKYRTDIPCFWKGRLNIVKMSILPNLICRVNAIPINIPLSYAVDINKMVLKFMWRSKRPRIANIMFKEKDNIKGLTSRLIIKLQ